MTNSHQDRVRVVHNLLRFCKEKGLSLDSPALADRIEALALRMCFSPATAKSLARSVIQILQMENMEALSLTTDRSQEAPAS